VAAAQLEQLKAQYEVFRQSLEEFAKKHRKDIASNPLLRNRFQQMCTSIGVDPLVCTTPLLSWLIIISKQGLLG